MYHLQMEQFLLSLDSSNFDDLFYHISEFHFAAMNDYLKVNEIKIKWNQCMDSAKDFMLLIEFTKQESLKFVEFRSWSIFPDTVVPVLRVLTHVFRERDCCCHLSAVKRVMPLFFFLLIVQIIHAGHYCILMTA